MTQSNRRNCINLFTPAELAIWQAKQIVEESGCHPLLTEAIDLLGQAQSKIADYVDHHHDHRHDPEQ